MQIIQVIKYFTRGKVKHVNHNSIISMYNTRKTWLCIRSCVYSCAQNSSLFKWNYLFKLYQTNKYSLSSTTDRYRKYTFQWTICSGYKIDQYINNIYKMTHKYWIAY